MPDATNVQTASFDTARELASAYGSDVHIPTTWPSDAGEVRFLLDRSDLSVDDRSYRVDALRSNGRPVLVAGRPRSHNKQADSVSGENGEQWTPVPELRDEDGLALVLNSGTIHVVLNRPNQIHIVGYDSLNDTVQVANTLERVEP